MMNLSDWVSACITILAVIIGGFITYIVQINFTKKNLERSQRLEIYLEFLGHATSIHSQKNLDEYWDIIRKMYLISGTKVLETLISTHYLPEVKVKFTKPKFEDEPMKKIVLAMKSDLGYKNDDKLWEKLSLPHWHNMDSDR